MHYAGPIACQKKPRSVAPNRAHPKLAIAIAALLTSYVVGLVPPTPAIPVVVMLYGIALNVIGKVNVPDDALVVYLPYCNNNPPGKNVQPPLEGNLY